MRVPAAMLRRTEALERRAAATDRASSPFREVLGFLTVVEMLEFEAILVEYVTTCTTCGADLRDHTKRCRCAPRPPQRGEPPVQFRPEHAARIKEFLELADARKQALSAGRFAELPDDVRRKHDPQLEAIA